MEEEILFSDTPALGNTGVKRVNCVPRSGSWEHVDVVRVSKDRFVVFVLLVKGHCSTHFPTHVG